MWERWGRRKQRKMDKRLMGMDNGGGVTVGVGEDGVGISNGGKGRTIITEKQ